jgi:hypothetical protein
MYVTGICAETCNIGTKNSEWYTEEITISISTMYYSSS